MSSHNDKGSGESVEIPIPITGTTYLLVHAWPSKAIAELRMRAFYAQNPRFVVWWGRFWWRMRQLALRIRAARLRT